MTGCQPVNHSTGHDLLFDQLLNDAILTKPAGPSPLWMARRIEVWETSKLIPYDRNARSHTPEQIKNLANLILQHGFTTPILVDEGHGILAGHARLEAAKFLELETVPVIEMTHLTEPQKRAYIIADNKIAADSGWDETLLLEELKAVEELGLLGAAGFTDEELAELEIEFPPGGDGQGDGSGAGRGLGTPVIQYTIIFDTEAQQRVWYDLLRDLKAQGQGETIAERLVAFIKVRG